MEMVISCIFRIHTCGCNIPENIHNFLLTICELIPYLYARAFTKFLYVTLNHLVLLLLHCISVSKSHIDKP